MHPRLPLASYQGARVLGYVARIQTNNEGSSKWSGGPTDGKRDDAQCVGLNRSLKSSKEAPSTDQPLQVRVRLLDGSGRSPRLRSLTRGGVL
jgi:hypothetical protein